MNASEVVVVIDGDAPAPIEVMLQSVVEAITGEAQATRFDGGGDSERWRATLRRGGATVTLEQGERVDLVRVSGRDVVSQTQFAVSAHHAFRRHVMNQIVLTLPPQSDDGARFVSRLLQELRARHPRVRVSALAPAMAKVSPRMDFDELFNDLTAAELVRLLEATRAYCDLSHLSADIALEARVAAGFGVPTVTSRPSSGDGHVVPTPPDPGAFADALLQTHDLREVNRAAFERLVAIVASGLE